MDNELFDNNNEHMENSEQQERRKRRRQRRLNQLRESQNTIEEQEKEEDTQEAEQQPKQSNMLTPQPINELQKPEDSCKVSEVQQKDTDETFKEIKGKRYESIPEDVKNMIKMINTYKFNTKFSRNIAGGLMILFSMGVILALASKMYIIGVQFLMSGLSFFFWMRSCVKGNEAVKKLDFGVRLKSIYMLCQMSLKFDFMALVLVGFGSFSSEFSSINLIACVTLIPAFMYLKYQYFISYPRQIQKTFTKLETQYHGTHQHSIRLYINQTINWNA